MKMIGRLLLILFAVLLPFWFAAFIWALAFYFNPPRGTQYKIPSH